VLQKTTESGRGRRKFLLHYCTRIVAGGLRREIKVGAHRKDQERGEELNPEIL